MKRVYKIWDVLRLFFKKLTAASPRMIHLLSNQSKSHDRQSTGTTLRILVGAFWSLKLSDSQTPATTERVRVPAVRSPRHLLAFSIFPGFWTSLSRQFCDKSGGPSSFWSSLSLQSPENVLVRWRPSRGGRGPPEPWTGIRTPMPSPPSVQPPAAAVVEEMP